MPGSHPHILHWIRFGAHTPLLLYIYLYMEVLGSSPFLVLAHRTSLSLDHPSFLTKTLAFGFTLLFYPFQALTQGGDSPTINRTYQGILEGVMEFSQILQGMGFIILSLSPLILPRLLLSIRSHLQGPESRSSFEVVQSMGGHAWESLRVTTMQIIRNRLGRVMLSWLRLCFFEALIALSLLFMFFVSHAPFFETQSSLTHGGGRLLSGFSLVIRVLLLASPVSAGLTAFLVFLTPFKVKDSSGDFPLQGFSSCFLLYGLPLFFYFQESPWGFPMALALVAVSKLSHGWTHLSMAVDLVHREAMKSMGMGSLKGVYELYVKGLFFQYFTHFLSVFCYLLIVVILLFCFYKEGASYAWTGDLWSLFSFEFYEKGGGGQAQALGSQSQWGGLTLLFLMLFKHFLDHRTSFWEAELG